MKKIFGIILMVVMLLSVSIAFGAEEIVTGEITEVVMAVDKNGNDYTRLIVKFDRTLEGTDYSVDLPVMAFGTMAGPAAQKSAGDTLKAICQKRIFNERESYTIVSLLE